MRRTVKPFILTFLCLAHWSSATHAQEVDWDHAVPLSGSSGFENPLVYVAFNPQPEPPAAGVLLDLSQPERPVLTLEYPPDPIHTFQILFALRSETPGWPYEMFLPNGGTAPPDSEGHYGFFAIGPGGDLPVTMDISHSGGSPIDFASWRGFNPQPEPPAFFEPGQSVGFDFTTQPAGAGASTRGVDTISVAFQLFDATGEPFVFAPVLSADFDEDGDVDGDDFLAWQSGFGNGATHAEGDADADGDVDGDDFLLWQNQFGSGSGGGAAAAAVPEPAACVLLLIGMMAIGFGKKTQREKNPTQRHRGH